MLAGKNETNDGETQPSMADRDAQSLTQAKQACTTLSSPS